MNLSSEELFHFTKFEYLKKIIEQKGFIPRFNLEFIHLSEIHPRKVSFQPIPMVCFCDIPYDLSKIHRERYGNCDIGLTENWKTNSNLNPIIYIQNESFLANLIADLNNCVTEDFLPLIIDYDDLRIRRALPRIANNIRYLSYFVKQFENKEEISIDYQGKIRNFEKRRFYDEKEWRYIPVVAEKYEELFLPIEYFDDEQKLKEAHENMIDYILKFDYSDIKYIIVENQNQADEILNFFSNQDTKPEIIVAN